MMFVSLCVNVCVGSYGYLNVVCSCLSFNDCGLLIVFICVI